MAASKKFYSLGYVVEDKVEDSFDIKVYPIEVIPTLNGELNYDNIESIVTKDRDGNSTSSKLPSSKYIDCTWYPNGEQNRITAPDVCKGDIVEIYTFGETDEYFWTVYAHNRALRKKEKVLFYFSNQSSVGGSSENGYYLLVDTKNKKIHLHTADNDGEATTYDILLNTSEGTLTVADGYDNSIILESVNGILNINTNEKIVVNTKDVVVNCKTSKINASDSVDINTSKMTIKSDVCNIN